MNPIVLHARTRALFFASLFALCTLPLFTGSTCAPTSTPQAVMFDTLQASAAGIDVFRASVQTEYDARRISPAQYNDFVRQYNQANEAIIAAAAALRDGMAATTPAEVDQFVRSLAKLVTTLVPPKPR